MKEQIIAAILLFLSAGSGCVAADLADSAGTSEGWKLASNSGGVAIYSRRRPGSPLKQFKGIGEIAAPTRTVHDVIADIEAYPRFMPYTVEARLLKRQPDGFLTYQRLALPFLSDRDYTIRMVETSRPGHGGQIYLSHWEPANELGPAEKSGVVRVKLNEGSWLLEPVDPDKTRLTYFINTDSGGWIPAFIANTGSRIAIERIFAGIRAQIKDPKYKP